MKVLIPIFVTAVCLVLFLISRYYFFNNEEDSMIKILLQGFLIGAVISTIFAFFNKRNKNNPES
ncbi:hypothetical protein [Chryseobacterium oryzae]|uniref:Histidine kinase n=1 Tax=Chryseobacterium oryzae TaxID=2929799 RepID=A0ABY4BHA7_9FLAO|nr:hypothetical protein [Chryseobacterium oryzae]UOE38129.1 hypothetical protein MTP08_13910 [Chryseobacterium oryzae]